jgi:hypothetical protein
MTHTSTTAEISLLDKRFEFVAECYRLRRIVGREHVTEILQHDITGMKITVNTAKK